MKNFRKIMAILMMLSILCAMAIPVSAAETYSITINHAQTDATHTYEAYQVFTGDLSKDKILSNIEWGDGVDSIGLMEALKGVELYKDAETAADVAAILDKKPNNGDVAIEFAKIVGEYLIEEKANASTANEDNTTYIIEDLAAGYYLIKDKDTTLGGENETYTSYILNILDDATINPKAGTVTVEKDINDNGKLKDAADFTVGEDITFELRGTLPDNYGEFKAFEYEFIDTMSKGLTFNRGTVEVYLNSISDETLVREGYIVKEPVVTDNGTTLRVKFEDLKKVTADKDATIIVKYTAKLNGEAVVGEPGNPNNVYIQYSNNPYDEDNGSNDDDDDDDEDGEDGEENEDEDDDDKGETNKEYVYAFTFELDVTKYNAEGDVLANAEFVLANADGKYAVLDDNKYITSWADTKEGATVLKSDAEGKFIVKGLDSGNYTLEETKAPEGYDLLEDVINIKIDAEVSKDTEGGKVDVLTITVDGGDAENGLKEEGIVKMGVINNPGIKLPTTGSYGTTIFYIFGGVLVVGAVILLVTKRRMNCNK